MKKLVLLTFGLILLGAGCFAKKPQNNSVDTGAQGQNPQEQAPPSSTVEDFINSDAVAVYESNTLQSVRSAQSNIYVLSPLPNATVGQSFTITGNARVFENVVSYRVKDPSGAVLASGYTVANSPDIGQYGAYQFNVNVGNIAAQPLTVEVYWQSAKDGSDADLVSYIVQKQ